MYERILVPLDGSSAAEIVLPYVEEIATKLGAEVTLVSVSEFTTAEVDHLYRSYLEPLSERVQRELKDYGAKEEVKVYSDVLLGKPADEIIRYANESNVGLIAMASRGSSGRGPWLLGNIAAKVLQATSKSVLLIRSQASGAAFQQKRLVKKILLPLDGSKIGEAAIAHAEALARALGAEIVLFHVVQPVTVWVGGEVDEAGAAMVLDEEGQKASASAYLDDVVKPIKERGLSVSIVMGSGPPADCIIDYAEANAIDLIAMSSHGRSGIGRWVFGSVTDKVLHTGDTAVLVIRATAA